MEKMDYLLKCTVIMVAVLSLVASLQLEGLSTQKPRQTKYNTLKPTGATVSISFFFCVSSNR